MLFFPKMKRKFHQMSLAKQLIIVIILAVFCLLVTTIGFIYQRTVEIINQQQSASNLEILNLKKSNFTNYISQMLDYSMMLRYNDAIYDIISSGKPPDYLSSCEICSALRNTFLSRSDLVSYRLYLLKSQTCFSIDRSDFNVRTSTFSSESKSRLFMQANSGKSNYVAFETDSSEKDGFLTLCRVFVNISNKRPLAYVEIKISNSFLQKLAGDSNGIHSILGIFYQGKQLAFSSNRAVLDKGNVFQILQTSVGDVANGSCSVTLHQEQYLAVFSSASEGEWKLLRLLPQDTYYQPIIVIRNLSLLLSLIAFLIIAFIIFALIEAQLHPLQTLTRQMQSVGRGDFKIMDISGGSAELNELERQFNSMTEQIDSLIQKNYVTELNEKVAQIKALEAQINPHFLYNTLQAISTEAILSGQKKIQQMIESLASLLRYSIHERDLVPLSIELNHVRQYLFLQSARFEERLVYQIQSDPDLGQMLIPKISILSLVENSIKHGLENSSGQIKISVSVCLLDRFLHITVSDNGQGMTQERLFNVRKMMERGETENSVGLSNLSARINLLYGNSASLSIDSKNNVGTKVQMIIPLDRGEKSKCIVH